MTPTPPTGPEENSPQAASPLPDAPAREPSARPSRVLRIALLIVATAAGVVGAFGAESVARFGVRGVRGNRIFYDQYHVHRHFIDGENVSGQWDYHIVSGYADFRLALEDAGYEVHVHREGRIRRGDLDGFDIFFVGEQANNGPEMRSSERREILRFVKSGGGLWAIAEHTNAHEIGARFNELMAPLGIQARYDSVCEDNGTVGSRDWLSITDLRPHPITRNMEILYTYNGCSLEGRHGIAFSSAASFSDAYNPRAKGRERDVHNGDNVRGPGEPSGPFAVVAARTYGKGRVAALCDHNAFSNTNLRDGSHLSMLLDGMSWLGHRRWNPDLFPLVMALVVLGCTLLVGRRLSVWRPPIMLGAAVLASLATVGALRARAAAAEPNEVLFLDGHGDGSTVHKKGSNAFSMLVKHADKSEEIRTSSQPRLRAGSDAIVLPGPVVPFEARELEVLDATLRAGRSVVYLATGPSRTSEAGRQLSDRYGFEVRPTGHVARGEIRLEGDERIRGDRRRYELRNRLTLQRVTGKGRQVRLRIKSDEHEGDLVTELERKGGRLVVVAPGEVFENANMTRGAKRVLRWIDLIGRFFRWATS